MDVCGAIGGGAQLWLALAVRPHLFVAELPCYPKPLLEVQYRQLFQLHFSLSMKRWQDGGGVII